MISSSGMQDDNHIFHSCDTVKIVGGFPLAGKGWFTLATVFKMLAHLRWNMVFLYSDWRGCQHRLLTCPVARAIWVVYVVTLGIINWNFLSHFQCVFYPGEPELYPPHCIRLGLTIVDIGVQCMMYALSLRILLLFDGSHGIEYTTNTSTKRKVDLLVFVAILQMHLPLVEVGFMPI